MTCLKETSSYIFLRKKTKTDVYFIGFTESGFKLLCLFSVQTETGTKNIEAKIQIQTVRNVEK